MVARVIRLWRRKPVSQPAPEPWSPATPLLALSPRDYWTIGDSFEGTQIFGATGSGKTSGSGAALARQMLLAGYGGLVLTVKPDDLALWQRYCAETGRSESLLVFGPGRGFSFNFLEYERRRAHGGGSTENIAELLLSVRRAMKRSTSRGSEDPFWEEAHQALLRNAIDLLMLADEPLTIPGMDRVVRSGPVSEEQVDDESWRSESYCAQCLLKAHDLLQEARSDDPRRATLTATAAYWLEKSPKLPERTRASVTAMFDALVDGLLRGEMREMFCGSTNVLPELTFEGAVLVIDLPVKRHHDLGRAAQILWKYLWQRAVEARDVRSKPRPVFLWADEAQNFFNAHDKDFQVTARSSRAATVYLTQTISNYRSAIGAIAGGDADSATDAFLAGLQTVVFHANADPVTNKWAEEYFAKKWGWRANSSQSGAPDGKKDNKGLGESLDPVLLAETFQSLRRGGVRDGRIVEAIIAYAGRRWNATGLPYLKAVFHQS